MKVRTQHATRSRGPCTLDDRRSPSFQGQANWLEYEVQRLAVDNANPAVVDWLSRRYAELAMEYPSTFRRLLCDRRASRTVAATQLRNIHEGLRTALTADAASLDDRIRIAGALRIVVDVVTDEQ